MKYGKILLFIFSLLCVNLNAQSKFKFGVTSNLGISTFYGNTKSTSEIPTKYASKILTGIGFKSIYSMNERLYLNLNLAYQKRGAKFDKGVYSYTPSYNFNYLDVNFGIGFQSKKAIKNSKLFCAFSGSYAMLLNSERKNDFESYDLINDSQMSDFNSSINIGFNTARLEKDLVQISLFANTGFRNVFSGSIQANGQIGKNMSFGLELTYLFGK